MSLKPNKAKSWQWCEVLSLHLVLLPCRCPRVDWKGCDWTCKLTNYSESRNEDEQSSRLKVFLKEWGPCLAMCTESFSQEKFLLLMPVMVWFPLTLFHRSYPSLLFISSSIFHCSSHTCLKYCSTSVLIHPYVHAFASRGHSCDWYPRLCKTNKRLYFAEEEKEICVLQHWQHGPLYLFASPLI